MKNLKQDTGINNLHSFIETYIENTSQKNIYNKQWLQEKKSNYIFLSPINNNVIYSLKHLYIYYEPILKEKYEDLSNFIINKSSSTEFSIELINWIKYPDNFQDYIQRFKFIKFILNIIYQLSSYYVILKLFKFNPLEINKYFSGVITDNTNLLIGLIICISNTEEIFWNNLYKTLDFLFINETLIKNDDFKLLLMKNINEKLINEIVNNYDNLRTIKIYSQINIDTFLVSGSFSDIERFKEIVETLEIPYNQNLIPYRDRIPDIKLSPVNITKPNFEEKFTIPDFLLEQKLIIPIYYEKQFYYEFQNDEINNYLLETRFDWNTCFLNISKNINESINVIDISSIKVDNYLLEILYNVYGTASKWFSFNITDEKEIYKTLYSKEKFFIKNLSTLNYNYNWNKRFTIRVLYENKNCSLVNSFTNFFKTPPIIVGGLLQYVSTINTVSNACCNGYFCEISTIELLDSFSFRNKITKIIKNIPSGEAIVINISVLEKWDWKFLLTVQLKREGVPIGVVNITGKFLEKNEIIGLINKFKNVNIYVIGLTPLVIEDIYTILELVNDFKNIKFLIFWNTCFSGYLRSFEDLYLPIFKNLSSFKGI